MPWSWPSRKAHRVGLAHHGVVLPHTRAPKTKAQPPARAWVAVVACASLLVGSIVVPFPARADAPTDAEAAIKKGTDLRRQGRDAEALSEFQRAARIRNTPRVEAQIALAEQALGSWVDANTHLTRALEHREDPWIEKNRSTLTAAQATIRTHLAEVEVWGTPPEATVELDHVLAGKLPTVTTWVALGDVELKVSAPGYSTLTRPLRIFSSTRAREHVGLHVASPDTSATIAATASGAPSGGAQLSAAGLTLGTSPNTTTGAAPNPDTGEHPSYRQWWFWAAVGVLAVGAGAGVYLLTRPKDNTCTPPACDTLPN